MDRTRMRTAEIKRMLIACADDEVPHSIEEFKQYIAQNTDKTFSIGQLSGALAQLTTLGELENIERGVYRKKSIRYEEEKQREAKEKQGSESKQDDETKQNNETKQNSELRKQIKICLTETEEKLAQIVGATTVWDLDDEEFELLKTVRWLSRQMNMVASKC